MVAMGHATVVNAHVRGHTLENSASTKVHSQLYYYFILCICFADDCVDDSDCGGSAKGACIDIQAITRPMKQCFCNPGWQGPGCGTGKFYTY